MDVFKIATMYNNDGLSLKEIAEKLGTSKSTIQRRLASNGWHYDRKQCKYFCTVDDNNNVLNETMNNVLNDVMMVGTYSLLEKDMKALKRKALEENKRVVDLIREFVKKSVEEKYYK